MCECVCTRTGFSGSGGGWGEGVSVQYPVSGAGEGERFFVGHTHIGSWYSVTCNSTDARNSYRARPHTTRPVHSDNGQRERGRVVVVLSTHVEWKHQQAFDSDGMTMYTAQHVNEHHDAQTDAHRQTTPQQ